MCNNHVTREQKQITEQNESYKLGLRKQVVREAVTICPVPCKLTFDLLTFKVVSESTCDVGYLCANFSLPRPLCSRLRPDVRDRQTSDTHYRLMPPTLGAGA